MTKHHRAPKRAGVVITERNRDQLARYLKDVSNGSQQCLLDIEDILSVPAAAERLVIETGMAPTYRKATMADYYAPSVTPHPDHFVGCRVEMKRGANDGQWSIVGVAAVQQAAEYAHRLELKLSPSRERLIIAKSGSLDHIKPVILSASGIATATKIVPLPVAEAPLLYSCEDRHASSCERTG